MIERVRTPGAGPPPSGSDEALIARVRERDSAALRVLFERHHRRVFQFVMRRLDDASLAEEVVADVFFEVWRSAGQFAGASRPSTWIFGIAQFKASGAHRDRLRRKRAAVVPINVESLHRVPDGADAGERLAAREELRRVGDSLASLPPAQREALELAVLEGLPYDEIARRLGVAEGTVKTRIARIRARLKRGSEAPGAEDGER